MKILETCKSKNWIMAIIALHCKASSVSNQIQKATAFFCLPELHNETTIGEKSISRTKIGEIFWGRERACLADGAKARVWFFERCLRISGDPKDPLSWRPQLSESKCLNFKSFCRSRETALLWISILFHSHPHHHRGSHLACNHLRTECFSAARPASLSNQHAHTNNQIS